MDYNQMVNEAQKGLKQLQQSLGQAEALSKGFMTKKTVDIKVNGVSATALIQENGSVHIVFEKGNESLANEVIKRVNDAS